MVSWELLVNGKNTTLKDIFSLDGSHWYGAAQVRSNQWPIEKWSRRQMAYVAGDSFADQWGGVQERYWLNSNGVAIFVEEDVPLFVGMNENWDRTLTLISKWNSPYRNIDSKNLHFKYSIIQGNDVRVCHDHVIKHVFAKPSGIPDELMFRFPIWSTWARYKKNINHKTVLEVNIHSFLYFSLQFPAFHSLYGIGSFKNERLGRFVFHGNQITAALMHLEV